MGIIISLIIGLIIGAVAKLFVRGPNPGGIIMTMILGVVGSAFASWVGSSLGWYLPGEAAGFIMSVIGAVIVLVVYKKIVGY
jgi:uncharacterized membrane protein YeaQ/YmgE (transglycosylase-associated protein family)